MLLFAVAFMQVNGYALGNVKAGKMRLDLDFF